MSSMRLNSAAMRPVALALAGIVAMAAVTGCEERPYSVPTRSTPYVSPKSQDLAGAPVPPPAYAAPSAAPPPPATYVGPAQTYGEASPAYPPPAPVQTYRPAPSYDTGGPMIVAMAPVPNPADGARSDGRTRQVYALPKPTPDRYAVAKPAVTHRNPPKHRRYASVAGAARTSHGVRVASGAKHAHPANLAHNAAAKPTRAPAAKPSDRAPVTARAVAPGSAPKTSTTPAKVAAAPQVNKAAPAASPYGKAALAKVAPDGKAATTQTTTQSAKPALAKATPAAPASQSGADRTTRLAALQAAMTDAVAKTGVLTAPTQFAANQPADVSLTLPADFAQTLRKEADRQGLSEEAASVNMTSVLSGDSFAATPADTQSQPLTVGQPTEFHWTVTPKPGVQSPLRADVGATLLGGGSETLSLGSVQKNAGAGAGLSPRVVGAGILALIVLLVLGWLVRGRNTPLRTASARRAAARRNGERPLDIGTDSDTAR